MKLLRWLSTDKTRPLLRNFAIKFLKLLRRLSTDKKWPLLRNFAIKFVKPLRWLSTGKIWPLLRNFAIKFVKLLWWLSTDKTWPYLCCETLRLTLWTETLAMIVHCQDLTIAEKLWNKLCETFVMIVYHLATRPDDCFETFFNNFMKLLQWLPSNKKNK